MLPSAHTHTHASPRLPAHTAPRDLPCLEGRRAINFNFELFFVMPISPKRLSPEIFGPCFIQAGGGVAAPVCCSPYVTTLVLLFLVLSLCVAPHVLLSQMLLPLCCFLQTKRLSCCFLSVAFLCVASLMLLPLLFPSYVVWLL